MAFQAVFYCALFVLVVVIVSRTSLFLFNKWWLKKERESSNEFTGILFGAISLVYSLIIAFVIVAVWQDYEELNQTIEQEADKLNSIISHSTTLPDSLKTPIQGAVREYCTNVVKEWEEPVSQKKGVSAIPVLRHLLLNTQPQGYLQEKVFDVLDDDLSNISNLKRERLGHFRSHLPTLVWLMLSVSSVIVILFSFYIDCKSAKFKKTGVTFLAIMVGMSIYLVYTLNKPFTGTMQVSNKPYQEILMALKTNG